ncbi:PaaI family thioesterase [Comamonas sp. GB3 AK4-5]|uniref:PaaI family thioesterase n=1 Tax=Comamonas sp. GB3 AK4-5 TaxID=3231487 RepID=UPI00351EA832
MDPVAFFWRMQRGELPLPPAFLTLGGSIVTVDAKHGTVETVFHGKPEFANPAGHIQGGFLSAMLDDTMGSALAAQLIAGQFAPTLSQVTQFLRPAQPGSISGLGRVLRRGSKICHLAGELSQHGRLIATATAVVSIHTMEP